MCHHCKSSKCHSDKKHEGGCSSKGIDQCNFNKCEGTYTIYKPGNYHLKKDVKGTISIQCSNVCLDLCCHKVDANGANNSIVIGPTPVGQDSTQKSYLKKVNSTEANISKLDFSVARAGEFEVVRSAQRQALEKTVSFGDVHDVKVFNGYVVGSTQDGIKVNNSFNVEFSDISFRKNSLNDVHVVSSNVLTLKNLTFCGKEGGQRALYLVSTDNINIDQLVATEYLSFDTCVIQVEDCQIVSFSNGDISLNTKRQASSVGELDVESAFVGFSDCHSVDLNRVNVDNNLFSIPEPSDPEDYKTNEALLFRFSSSCSLNRCGTNDNSNPLGNEINVLTEDFPLCFWFCESCTVQNHKSNNYSVGKIYIFSAIASLDSNDMLVENCQANGNVLDELEPTQFSVTKAIWFTSFFAPGVKNNTLRKSQANQNRIISGGSVERSTLGIFSSIHMTGDNFIIEDCEASHNSMDDSVDLAYLVGIFVSFTGSYSTGNANLNSCVVNNNRIQESGSGIDIGILILYQNGSGPEFMPGYVNIFNCSVSKNNLGISLGIPISIFPLPQSANNINITETTVTSNASTGISTFDTPTGSRNVIVKNSVISDNGGEGISLDPLSARCVIQDNIALNNLSVGFEDNSSSANSWFGNKAEDNSADYFGIIASTYSKSTGIVAGGASANNISSLTNLSLIA